MRTIARNFAQLRATELRLETLFLTNYSQYVQLPARNSVQQNSDWKPLFHIRDDHLCGAMQTFEFSNFDHMTEQNADKLIKII